MFRDELFQTKEPKTFHVSAVKSAFLTDGKGEGVKSENLYRYIQAHEPLLALL